MRHQSCYRNQCARITNQRMSTSIFDHHPKIFRILVVVVVLTTSWPCPTSNFFTSTTNSPFPWSTAVVSPSTSWFRRSKGETHSFRRHNWLALPGEACFSRCSLLLFRGLLAWNSDDGHTCASSPPLSVNTYSVSGHRILDSSSAQRSLRIGLHTDTILIAWSPGLGYPN